MTPTKARATHCAAAIAPPTYPISDGQLDRVVAALPPLIAGAPLAWHRTHRKWVAQEIAAFRPADAAQAGVAEHIVVLRHIAASMTSAAFRQTGSLAWAGHLDRAVAALTRAGVRMERTLRVLRRRAASAGDRPAGDGRTGDGRTDDGRTGDGRTGDVPAGDVPAGDGLTGDGLAQKGFNLPGPDAIFTINPLQLSATATEPATPATGRRPGGSGREAVGFGNMAPPLFLSAGPSVASRGLTLARPSRPKRASRARSAMAAAPAAGGDA